MERLAEVKYSDNHIEKMFWTTAVLPAEGAAGPLTKYTQNHQNLHCGASCWTHEYDFDLHVSNKPSIVNIEQTLWPIDSKYCIWQNLSAWQFDIYFQNIEITNWTLFCSVMLQNNSCC